MPLLAPVYTYQKYTEAYVLQVLFKAYTLGQLLVYGPGHGSHECASQHPRHHALEVALYAVFVVDIHDYRPQTVELGGVQLHFGFDHVGRLGGY